MIDRIVKRDGRIVPFNRDKITFAVLSAAVAGGAIVVGGYLLAGMILSGVAAAVAEVPMNILQVAAGAVVAVPLFIAVRQAYPPITRLAGPR